MLYSNPLFNMRITFLKKCVVQGVGVTGNIDKENWPLNIHLQKLCAMSLIHKNSALSVFNSENVIMLGCK
jgi:hypothetical protein